MYPYLDNGRLIFKHSIRRQINHQFPKDQRSNFVHAVDNVAEAWEYMDVTIPHSRNIIYNKLDNI